MNELSVKLKRLRMARRVTQYAVARKLNVSKSLIAAFEQGRLIPQEDTAGCLDDFFGTGNEIRDLAAQAHEERERERREQPTWFAPWPDLERIAVAIRSFGACVIPGLGQTKEYAQVILSCGLLSVEQVDRYAARRLARQAAVFDREDPPVVQLMIDELALHRGAPEVMRGQLLHLQELGQRPHVLVQVIPKSAGMHLGQAGGFAIADLPGGQRAGFVDHLEGQLVTAPKQVGDLERAWQAVSGAALPCHLSEELITRMVHELDQH